QKVYEDKDMAGTGFDSLTFMGGTVVGDSHCPTSAGYGLCLDDLEIHVDPDYNFAKSGWFELKQIGFPHAAAYVMTWSGNVVCKDRRTNFKMTGLDYTA
ncbi:MAG: hypothetical protein ACXABY_23950, partial [Candidatus Thorarchaeota archaeon]